MGSGVPHGGPSSPGPPAARLVAAWRSALFAVGRWSAWHLAGERHFASVLAQPRGCPLALALPPAGRLAVNIEPRERREAMNSIQLIGRLTEAPEARSTKEGQAVTRHAPGVPWPGPPGRRQQSARLQRVGRRRRRPALSLRGRG
jgi:hypothetical protein